MPVGLCFLLVHHAACGVAPLQFNPRLARVIKLNTRFSVVRIPVLLGSVTILEDDTRRAELSAVALPYVIEMNFVEEGFDCRNKVGNMGVINPELAEGTSVLFVLFEFDLLDLSKFEFVEDISHIVLGYTRKSHDKDARHGRMKVVYFLYFNFYRTLLGSYGSSRKKVGFASPFLFLHAYESRSTYVVSDAKDYWIKVKIPLYLVGLLPAWSRYDSQRLDVLWGIVFCPCLLLVAVVHVLRLHGCMKI